MTNEPLLLDDEWEPPPPSRARIVLMAAGVGIVLIVACVELLRSRERMWEPENESVWVPFASVPAALSPETDFRTEPATPPTPPLPKPRAVAETAPSYLSINSSPWAELSVDGHFMGNTPQIRIRVMPGRHHLLLAREGFRTHSAWVDVPAGRTVRLTNITLTEMSR